MTKLIYPLATGVLFSGSYVAGKYTTLDLGPLTATWLRYAVALLFLLTLIPRCKPGELGLRRTDLGWFVLLSLAGVIGYHYFFFASLRHTLVANTALINALSPIMTGAAAAALLGERLVVRNYVGVVLSCAGVVLLLTNGQPDVLLAFAFNRGDVLMLLAVCCWVAYALIVRRLLDTYSGFALTWHSTLIAVIVLPPLVAFEGFSFRPDALSRASVWSILYMGAGVSGLGYLLYNLSIREIGPTRTSGIVYGIIPMIVAVLALVFFDQPVTAQMAASFGLILCGLYLMQSGTRRARQ